jgi:CBS domain-containing protein
MAHERGASRVRRNGRRVIQSATESPATLKKLLRGVVDYAGLFPPASLAMPAAVAEYAEHRASDDEWMLGRFVVPAARLEEFEAAAAGVMPTQAHLSWALSALLGSDPEEDIERAEAFNKRHVDARAGAVLVDTVELKANSAREVARAGELLDRRFDTYMEVPVTDDPGELIAAIARTMAKAKIRTGGVTREAFPSPAQVVRFIARCLEHNVSFKATAGLHHPWTADYPLTYAADAPSGPMFGFLNVAVATAALRAGWSLPDATAVLEERDRRSITLGNDGLSWRGRKLSPAHLQSSRDSLAAFGSCSFRDPVSGLRESSLL